MRGCASPGIRTSTACGGTELELGLLEPSLLFGSRTLSLHWEPPNSADRNLELTFMCDCVPERVQSTRRWRCWERKLLPSSGKQDGGLGWKAYKSVPAKRGQVMGGLERDIVVRETPFQRLKFSPLSTTLGNRC